MGNRRTVMSVASATAVVLWLTGMPVLGQQGPLIETFPPYKAAPRTADGRPNLSGIWQAMTPANFNIEDHEQRPGLYPELEGAWTAEHAGQGIVEGGEIPYRPEMLAKRQQNFETRGKPTPPRPGEEASLGDPELKCWTPGVPRSMYMPFPFQIVQTPDFILIAHEYNTNARIIRMNWKEESPLDNTFWMGWNRGRWEGETLVVDVTAQIDQTWFDRAGNFHSDALHVVERFTPVSPYHLLYEATIDDPKVFTRPWKISLPLYRRMEKNVQLMEFKCVPFVEEMLYGSLAKKPAGR